MLGSRLSLTPGSKHMVGLRQILNLGFSETLKQDFAVCSTLRIWPSLKVWGLGGKLWQGFHP